MPRKQFTFYESFLQSARRIKRSTDREKFLMAIIEFALEEKEPENLPECCDVAFSAILPTLITAKKRSDSGKKGGEANASKAEANGSKQEANASKAEASTSTRNRTRNRTSTITEATESKCQELWDSYPAHRRGSIRDLIQAVEDASLSEADMDKAIRYLSIWRNSADWQKNDGQYVPGITRYIESGMYQRKPPSPDIPTGASGELGEAELEAIRRVLSQPLDDVSEGDCLGKLD